MILEPVISEKSLKLAEGGKYTFRVQKNLTKHQIKELINRTFNVHTQKIRTIKIGGNIKKTLQGRKKILLDYKKAIVTLGEKEKIDLFETKKK